MGSIVRHVVKRLRFDVVAVLAVVAILAGGLAGDASAAPKTKPKPKKAAAAPANSAEAMLRGSGARSFDDTPDISLRGDPRPGKLVFDKNDFEVDEPVTPELLAKINAKKAAPTSAAPVRKASAARGKKAGPKKAVDELGMPVMDDGDMKMQSP